MRRNGHGMLVMTIVLLWMLMVLTMIMRRVGEIDGGAVVVVGSVVGAIDVADGIVVVEADGGGGDGGGGECARRHVHLHVWGGGWEGIE